MARQLLPSDVLPSAVAYATAIPLDSTKTLPRTFVSAPITFTVGATANGGQAILPLVADGVNAVTFTGFTEAGTSSGYDNTSGRLNLIQFFYLDGTAYWSASQAVGAQPIYQVANAYSLTGPNTATVGGASNAFTVQANGTLASAVTITPNDGGAGGTFTPATVSLAAGSTPSSATFTYTPAGSAGSRTIATTNNGGLTNPASVSLTANAAVARNFARLTTISGLTEAVNSNGGYNYTNTSTSVGYGGGAGYGVTSIAVPANSDGFFGAVLPSVGANGVLIGLSVNAANATYSGISHGLYADTGAGAPWQIISGGNPYAPQTSVTAAGTDVGRVRRINGTTTMVAEVSKDGGSTYTTIYTWTGAPTAALYGHYQTGNQACPITQPFASANAA